MKIAILAPPYLPIPPLRYGGTERIVSLLADGLVGLGHNVTLFASGDSHTSAKLASVFPKAIGNSGLEKGDRVKPLAHYQACYDRANEFDLIHSHGQYLSLAGARGLAAPVVFTWHGSFYPGEAPEEKRRILRQHRQARFVTISNNQRGGMPELNYVATVYNGLDLAGYSFAPRAGDYLLWVGRITRKKGPEAAIEAARLAGLRLEMAATIDPIDRPYFDDVIRPRIDGKAVVFHGEMDLSAMRELYGGAAALLFPITWHEPFGLVMIEAMACGTPVVAYNCGSVPEIVDDGKTGFIVEPDDNSPSPPLTLRGGRGALIKKRGIEGLVEAVKQIGSINRTACRARVEQYFSSSVMVEGYENAYKKILPTL